MHPIKQFQRWIGLVQWLILGSLINDLQETSEKGVGRVRWRRSWSSATTATIQSRISGNFRQIDGKINSPLFFFKEKKMIINIIIIVYCPPSHCFFCRLASIVIPFLCCWIASVCYLKSTWKLTWVGSNLLGGLSIDLGLKVTFRVDFKVHLKVTFNVGSNGLNPAGGWKWGRFGYFLLPVELVYTFSLL